MKKLLIVDNSNVIINVLTDLFNKEKNFKVYIAKTFEEATKLLDIHSFYASISNIVLPDALNGELLNILDSKNIPMVVLTSNMDEQTRKLTQKYNIIDYISKDSFYELESAYKLINLLIYIEDEEILVVDDSLTISTRIKENLESLLFKIHTARNGVEALEVLENNPKISLIITDYDMNKMNGLELIKKVRKKEHFQSIPILIMTTSNCSDLRISFYKNGANDFLLKPIITEELKIKIINIYSNNKHLEDIAIFNKIIDEHVITSRTDTKGVIKDVSTAFCKIAGFTKEEMIGKPHNIVRHPQMPSSLYKELWGTIKSGNTWTGEIKNIRRDNTFYWVKAVIEPNRDKKGNIIGYTSVREDITDKKRIYELSITDGLTSLFNRRYFNDISHEVIENTNRNNEVFAFLLLDIDNFKKYNDTYGHQEGDNVLINVSKSLKNTFKRNDDKIFRLGGEEFGVLISAKYVDDILTLSNNARKDIENLNIPHKKNNPTNVITASFGLSILESNKDNLDFDDIYKITDNQLYKAKENGRNRLEYIKY